MQPHQILTRRLAEAQNWKCCYCYREMTMKDENSPVRTTDATQEHVVARWRGGKRIWENLVAACSFCNHARPKDVSAYEFISPYILEKRKIENKKEKQRLKNARRRLRRKQLDASFKQFMDMVPAV